MIKDSPRKPANSSNDRAYTGCVNGLWFAPVTISSILDFPENLDWLNKWGPEETTYCG